MLEREEEPKAITLPSGARKSMQGQSRCSKQLQGRLTAPQRPQGLNSLDVASRPTKLTWATSPACPLTHFAMSQPYLPYYAGAYENTIPMAQPFPPPPLPNRPTPSTSTTTVWTRPGRFYVGGSAAPFVVSRRNNNNHTSYQPSSYSAPPQPSVEVGGSSHGSDEGCCCCCGARLRFEKGKKSFRCSICHVVTDIERGRPTGAFAPFGSVKREALSTAPFVPAETPSTMHIITPLDVEDLSQQLRRGSLTIEETFASRVSAVFSDLGILDASFRYDSDLPSLDTLGTFYRLVGSRPAAMDALREAVVSLLLRPNLAAWCGNFEESDGSAFISLFEVSYSIFSKSW